MKEIKEDSIFEDDEEDEDEFNEMDVFSCEDRYSGDASKSLLTNNCEENDVGSKTNLYEASYDEYIGLYLTFGLLQFLGFTAIAIVLVWTGVYMGGFSWDGTHKTFNWHPVLMTVGLVYCYGNAAVLYRVCRSKEKYTVKVMHYILNLVAFLCAVCGVSAVLRNHNHNNIANGYTLHSWIGIGAVVLYACQLLFGFLAFLYPTFDDSMRAMYLKVHVFFGGIVLCVVVAACVSGVTEKNIFRLGKEYATLPGCAVLGNMLGVAITLFAATVGYILYNKDWKRSN